MKYIKCITNVIAFVVPVYIFGKTGEKIGIFLLTPPNVYYVLGFIIFFIFWYGFFELAKK